MEPLDGRFWKKVKKDGAIPEHAPELGPCWEWQSTLSSNGYGMFKIGQRNYRAHRLAWEEVHGSIPEGYELDHLCRNRRCVNPSHIECVTHAENMHRGAAAQKTHCKRGHPLSGDNVRLGEQGQRVCKACSLLRCYERRARMGMGHRDKLTPDQVREIRAWHASLAAPITIQSRGAQTISAVAKQYGVARWAIQSIISGKAWKKLD